MGAKSAALVAAMRAARSSALPRGDVERQAVYIAHANESAQNAHPRVDFFEM